MDEAEKSGSDGGVNVVSGVSAVQVSTAAPFPLAPHSTHRVRRLLVKRDGKSFNFTIDK